MLLENVPVPDVLLRNLAPFILVKKRETYISLVPEREIHLRMAGKIQLGSLGRTTFVSNIIKTIPILTPPGKRFCFIHSWDRESAVSLMTFVGVEPIGKGIRKEDIAWEHVPSFGVKRSSLGRISHPFEIVREEDIFGETMEILFLHFSGTLRLNAEDVERALNEKIPSLKGKKITTYFVGLRKGKLDAFGILAVEEVSGNYCFLKFRDFDVLWDMFVVFNDFRGEEDPSVIFGEGPYVSLRFTSLYEPKAFGDFAEDITGKRGKDIWYEVKGSSVEEVVEPLSIDIKGSSLKELSEREEDLSKFLSAVLKNPIREFYVALKVGNYTFVGKSSDVEYEEKFNICRREGVDFACVVHRGRNIMTIVVGEKEQLLEGIRSKEFLSDIGFAETSTIRDCIREVEENTVVRFVSGRCRGKRFLSAESALKTVLEGKEI